MVVIGKMNTKSLIGNRIKDIYVWTEMEVGGLDQGQVFVELTTGQIVRIPWDFDSENIETNPKTNSKSLIQKSPNKFKVNSIEFNLPKGKTFQDVRKEVKTKQNSTFFGRLKSVFKINYGIPKKYISKTTGIVDNEMKKLKNLKITDFLMFEDSDSVGYLELENGNIITETLTAPHGTGMAGLNVFENLKDFENLCGTEYKRLTTVANNV